MTAVISLCGCAKRLPETLMRRHPAGSEDVAQTTQTEPPGNVTPIKIGQETLFSFPAREISKTTFSSLSRDLIEPGNVRREHNRSLVYYAADNSIYFLSGQDKLIRLITESPGYETVLNIGKETAFSLSNNTTYNVQLCSDDKGSLYISAWDSYEQKTVIYKLTLKD
jgi:hypothetical protein